MSQETNHDLNQGLYFEQSQQQTEQQITAAERIAPVLWKAEGITRFIKEFTRILQNTDVRLIIGGESGAGKETLAGQLIKTLTEYPYDPNNNPLDVPGDLEIGYQATATVLPTAIAELQQENPDKDHRAGNVFSQEALTRAWEIMERRSRKFFSKDTDGHRTRKLEIDEIPLVAEPDLPYGGTIIQEAVTRRMNEEPDAPVPVVLIVVADNTVQDATFEHREEIATAESGEKIAETFTSRRMRLDHTPLDLEQWKTMGTKAGSERARRIMETKQREQWNYLKLLNPNIPENPPDEFTDELRKMVDETYLEALVNKYGARDTVFPVFNKRLDDTDPDIPFYRQLVHEHVITD